LSYFVASEAARETGAAIVARELPNRRLAALPASALCRRLLGTSSMVALGLVLATSTPSRATDWTGANSTDWFAAGNWSAGVPTSAVDANIDTSTPNATVVGATGAQANTLFVGNSGTGALTIRNGGTVSDFTGYLGNAGSTGTATVDGAGSAWTNSGNLLVGLAGTGTLTIRNGGTVSNNYGILGFNAGSTGTATVDGAGSAWTNSADLYVGYTGAGTLTIQNGGAVSNNFGFLGGTPGSTGTATVDGAGSAWTNSSNLYVGLSGTGTLTIRNGGAVSNTAGYLGNVAGSTGTVTVDGAGSTWTNSSNLYVGYDGAGTLTIANGGAVSAAAGMTIAQNSGSTGTLNIGAATGQAAAAPGTLTTPFVAFGAGTGGIVFNHTASNYTFAPVISGAGSVTVENGTTILTATNTYSGGTTINGGILNVGSAGALGTTGTISFTGGTLQYSAANTTDYSSRFSNAANQAYHIDTNDQTVTVQTALTSLGGTFTKDGTGTLSFSGANTYSGATTINAGTLKGAATNTFSATSATTINTGGTLDLGFLGQTINTVSLSGGTLTNGNLSGAVSSSGGSVSNIGGTANLTTNSGTTTANGTNTYTGATTINGGTLAISGSGSVTSSVTNNSILTNNGAIAGTVTNAATFNNNVGGTVSGLLTNNSGTTTSAGALNGGAVVNGGLLAVNGTAAAVTVNAGGTLGGNGTVGNTTINGGALAPGNSIGTLTVAGNLVLTSAASYMVEVSPANADRTNVTGTAALGGATVNASFAAGTYVAKQYTIVNATGGVNGTFSGPVNTNLPSGFHTSLSYDGNDAFLNLLLNFVPPPGTGLSGNQQNVGNAIINSFNTTGGIPIVFGGLTPAGLSQLSGEVATESQQTTFNAMGLFMGLLTDPFIDGRGDPVSAGSSAGGSAYAAQDRPRSGAARDANAMFTKAPGMSDSFAQRWSVWAAGYGGSQTTDGNAALGSNTATSRIAGTAVGADYRISPYTLAGFALAGGGTNFNVANNGSGRSDLFQAGAFIRHNAGAAYLSGALAYGWQDITTNRTVTVAGIDQLRAQFNANAFSGRVEGGYRYVSPWMGGIGLTPYAAGQFTTFDLPAYAEQAVTGVNTFALAYGSKSVTDTRSELGLRTDKSYAMQDGIFTVRARAAWAHDFNPDRNIGATFQTLPGASFVVGGAAQASDSALVTASAEKKWLNGWSAAATFEGEFSQVTTSYAGKGVVRYSF
jgi:T5SS/PEP-CTERM-associated repeat protein/autotransporter-associated beta strand protein